MKRSVRKMLEDSFQCVIVERESEYGEYRLDLNQIRTGVFGIADIQNLSALLKKNLVTGGVFANQDGTLDVSLWGRAK